MPLTNADHLRLLIGERIPEGGLDTDTFFSDDDIADLLTVSGNDINVAASLGWRAKAAEFAKYIDIDESGSTRKLSQMYRQAVLQAEHFAKVAGDGGEQRVQSLRSGIVARSAQWAVPADARYEDPVHNSSGEFRSRA